MTTSLKPVTQLAGVGRPHLCPQAMLWSLGRVLEPLYPERLHIKFIVDENVATYPNALDPANKVVRAYRIQGMPETFFIGGGEIASFHIGPLTKVQLVTRIERLLAQ